MTAAADGPGEAPRANDSHHRHDGHDGLDARAQAHELLDLVRAGGASGAAEAVSAGQVLRALWATGDLRAGLGAHGAGAAMPGAHRASLAAVLVADLRDRTR